MTALSPLVGKQAVAVANSTARVNIYEGSVRSSKTICSLIDWVRYCRVGPPGTLLMTGKTERTIYENLIDPLIDMLGADRISINRGLGTVDLCGRKVLVIGANNELARTKIQGKTLAGCYVDEAPTLPESFWNMLLTRLSVPGARAFATGNPETPSHFLKKKWLDRAKLWVDHDGNIHDRRLDFLSMDMEDPERPLDLHRFSFTLDDNPSLDPDYVQSIKTFYSGVWYQRMVRGLWVGAEGVIYDSFDPARHIIPWSSLPAMRDVLGVGIDHGATNPTVALILGLGMDDRLYVLDEWKHIPRSNSERWTNPKLSAGLREWLAQNHLPYRNGHGYGDVIVDPAAAQFRLQLSEDGVFNHPAENAVDYGLETVAALFAAGLLYITDRCTMLAGEIPEYRWDPDATAKGIDAPIKVDDHAVDSLRYGIVTTERKWRRWVDLTIRKRHSDEKAAA